MHNNYSRFCIWFLICNISFKSSPSSHLSLSLSSTPSVITEFQCWHPSHLASEHVAPPPPSVFVANPTQGHVNATPPPLSYIQFAQLPLVVPPISDPSQVQFIDPPLPTTLNINAHFRDPLTDANNYNGRFHFNTILRIQKLRYVVEHGALPELFATGEVNPAFNCWYTIDQPVMLWILATISPSIENMIQHCLSNKEAWDVLEQFLAPNYAVNIKMLKDKRHQAKKTPTLSMLDYIVSIKMTVEALWSTGHAFLEIQSNHPRYWWSWRHLPWLHQQDSTHPHDFVWTALSHFATLRRSSAAFIKI